MDVIPTNFIEMLRYLSLEDQGGVVKPNIKTIIRSCETKSFFKPLSSFLSIPNIQLIK